MVDIKDIVPGATFQIVDKWNNKCGQNSEGLMDKYLGTVCTVIDIVHRGGRYLSFKIYEDQDDRNTINGWIWNSYCVNYCIDDSHMDKISISEEEFNAII